MQKVDWETRVDNVDRADIWRKEAENWLDSFKSEETPIEKRITDYKISGWTINANNENEIRIQFYFEVTPVDGNNTAWEMPERSFGNLEMTNVDGEYKLDYISEYPQNYDKFLEEFEKWKEENSTKETIVVPSESRNLNASQEQEIDRMSTGIVAVCIGVLAVVSVLVVMKIIKLKK